MCRSFVVLICFFPSWWTINNSYSWCEREREPFFLLVIIYVDNCDCGTYQQKYRCFLLLLEGTPLLPSYLSHQVALFALCRATFGIKDQPQRGFGFSFSNEQPTTTTTQRSSTNQKLEVQVSDDSLVLSLLFGTDCRYCCILITLAVLSLLSSLFDLIF